MRKKIYDGYASGIFVYGAFDSFMSSLNGAEVVRGRFFEDDKFQIWNVSPFGVTLWYDCENHTMGDKAKVVLVGEEKGIGEVEKIILAEAKKTI